MLVGVGLYILANYLRALAWALVLAVAIWPFYDRIRRQMPPPVAKEVLPILFTALVGLAVFLPFATLGVDAIREVQEIVDYGRCRTSSFDYHTWGAMGRRLVARAFIACRLGQGDRPASEHVFDPGTRRHRCECAAIGANAVHRVVLFGVCLLTLFFLFRHGESISMQCRTASEKVFGERGERVALQMVASVHGTVTGLVLVAIGEGVLLGFVYFLTKLPHPILRSGPRGWPRRSRSARKRRSRTRLSAVEPVSAPPKRKLENRHQRPEPETRPARAEMPEIADQRLGHPSLICGNVGDSPPPGNNTPETGLAG